VKTIERATSAGWSKETIGHHIVRNNTVSHCEQAGIVGSLGPVFSVVTGNTIHDVYVRQLFSGAEIAGIKFHAAIDVEISHNHIYRSCRGLWLDWMAQGTSVSGNLFHDNQCEDMMIEVDHGPFVVDNNVCLSKISQRVVSQGGAYLHNLFCGGVTLVQYDSRQTPFMKPHSTIVAGYHDNPSGDMRFFNNLFAQGGDLSLFNETRIPMQLAGNVFLKGAKPCSQEPAPMLKPEFDPDIQLVETSGGVQLSMSMDRAWITEQKRRLVTSAILGFAAIPNLPFEDVDGTALRIERDYSGQIRDLANPSPGPFEYSAGGAHTWNLRPAQR
jgi:alpha-N-arabinofuranosidase